MLYSDSTKAELQITDEQLEKIGQLNESLRADNDKLIEMFRRGRDVELRDVEPGQGV